MSLTAVYFDNISYFKTVLPQSDMEVFREDIEFIKTNIDSLKTSNHTLAGNIAKEYQLDQDSINAYESVLLPYARSYIENNRCLFKSNYDKLKLKSSWVNFQKKYEFNPIHYHDGIISYVIWVKIPYHFKDEVTNISVQYSNTPLAGSFQFLYNDILGNITTHNINCDATMESTLLMFPSQLRHAVYPFYTSDDYRITISGNFLQE
jgi:hypothetical protein